MHDISGSLISYFKGQGKILRSDVVEIIYIYLCTSVVSGASLSFHMTFSRQCSNNINQAGDVIMSINIWNEIN